MGEYNDAFMRNQNSAVQSRTKAQNRANVLQLKLIGQSHPTGLTNSLLKLFEPRPPLEFKPPPEKRKCLSLTGMAQFVSKFAEPTDPEYAPPVPTAETPAERRARIHKLRLEKGAEKAAEELPKYLERDDPNVTGDPYKTLFVARLNYETNESRVKREFESYGPIKRVRLVTDQESGKPRGYAFIEYVHKRDMKAAYKQADGKKIDGRRVLVDVERGRTVPNWRPRRLGGGLGTSRVGGELNQREPGREQVQPGGQSQSEEPRVREDRHVERDREKSNDRGRDKEREQEKSRERSHDKPRDRDHREDRHHRDRDRIRDKDRERDREKERDRGHDRDRARDRGRDRGRDTERDRERERDREHDRNRLRERERERDYESGSLEHERGRSRDRDRELEYDRVESKHERDKHREMDYDHGEPEDDGGWYENSELGRRHPDPDHDAEQYDQYEKHRGRRQYEDQAQGEHDRYEQYSDRDRDQYDRMEGDYDYKSREKERTRDGEDEYRRSERSLSRDY